MKISRTRFGICLMWSNSILKIYASQFQQNQSIRIDKTTQTINYPLKIHVVATHVNDFIDVITPLNVWFYEIHHFFCQILKSIYKLNKFFSQQMTYIFDIVLQFVKTVFNKVKTNLLVAPQEVNTEEILLHTFFNYSILTNSLTF